MEYSNIHHAIMVALDNGFKFTFQCKGDMPSSIYPGDIVVKNPNKVILGKDFEIPLERILLEPDFWRAFATHRMVVQLEKDVEWSQAPPEVYLEFWKNFIDWIERCGKTMSSIEAFFARELDADEQRRHPSPLRMIDWGEDKKGKYIIFRNEYGTKGPSKT